MGIRTALLAMALGLVPLSRQLSSSVMLRHARNLGVVVLASTVWGANAQPQAIIEGMPGPESIVVSGETYVVSSIGSQGQNAGIYTFDKEGKQLGKPVEEVTRGLAITKDQKTLYAAHDRKVSRYAIGENGALTKEGDMATPFYKPNGICLTEDEGSLFITDPGYTLGLQAVTLDTTSTGGLVRLEFTGNKMSIIFLDDRDNYSPNGCKVMGEKVYMVNSAHGVTTYDMTSGEMNVEEWSEDLAKWQRGDADGKEWVGDGIVFHGSNLYLSFWRLMFQGGGPVPEGKIFKCTETRQCEEFLGMAAADIDLHGDTLLMPSLPAGKVFAVELAGGSTSPAPPAPTCQLPDTYPRVCLPTDDVAPKSGVHLLSCAYGMSQCLGLRRRDGIAKARQLGCPTTDDGEYFGATTRGIGSRTLDPALPGSESTDYQDGMPCTFSPDSDAEDLKNLKLSDIVITFEDGSHRNPTGATFNPANEKNELLTLLMVGHFGFSEGKRISSVSIKGSTYDGPGLSYADMGHELVFAKWWAAADHLKLENGRTHCGATYTDTTHLIQVVFNGGMSVTFKDNKKLPFAFDKQKHKQIFKIFYNDGSELPAEKFLGLADEADGDNYVDLCMKLTDDDVRKFSRGSGAKMRLLSTRECSFLVLPKGDCQNSLVGAKCGDSSTRSQEICVTAIPGAQAGCDPKAPSGKYRFYNASSSEIGALRDCHFVTPER